MVGPWGPGGTVRPGRIPAGSEVLPVRGRRGHRPRGGLGRPTGLPAQLACPASWQFELYRREGGLGVSGGLADFEMGHWAKTLQPGDGYATPWALVTVAQGTLDRTSQRLLDLFEPVNTQVQSGRIPQVFNEFCSTWGQPSHGRVLRQLEALRGRGLDYFVIDAGWYADPRWGWERNHGDWEVAPHLFPGGLGPTAAAIREAGLCPGLWFEWETCGPDSSAFGDPAHLLCRHGATITSGQRRFWDLTDPWVVKYLSRKVIGRLKDDGFGDIKVDYNESMGIGCDGAESLREGLVQRIGATQEFFRKLRRDVPGLVIENCASGGHRLEASMVWLSDFSSFSDAHECLDIPVIAANLHRLVPPWHSQIWAVVRRADTDRRIVYSMAATFLGVPCLSGEVEDLEPGQWAWIDAGLRFHRRLSPLLCGGTTDFFGTIQGSYRDLKGWQGILRTDKADRQALVVVHRFAGECPRPLEVPLPWEGELVQTYGLPECSVGILGRTVRVEIPLELGAVGVLLKKRD